MSNAAVVLAAAFVVTVIVVMMMRAWTRARWYRADLLPDALTGSTLFASERAYRIRRPIPLSGIVDQVFRSGNRLTVTDTKRRPVAKAYYSDRVQLSLYRLLLERGANPWWRFWVTYTVDPVGWVRNVTPKGVVYVPVELLPVEQMVALHERYWSTRQGKRGPAPAASAGLCHKCLYRPECRHVRPQEEG